MVRRSPQSFLNSLNFWEGRIRQGNASGDRRSVHEAVSSIETTCYCLSDDYGVEPVLNPETGQWELPPTVSDDDDD